MQTIGILLPRSTYYQTLGFDLFQGFKSAFKNIERDDIRIVTENIGFGADKQQCYKSAEKLILEENAAVVVAYIGQQTAQLLRPLFLAMNRLLIVLDAGANLPHEADYCPNIIYHSFHNSVGAWLASKEAIKDGHTDGGMVTGYYDGGYLHTLSLTEGFVKNGGTIKFNVATGFKPDTFSMDELVPYLESNPNSALLTLFSADFVQWYFKELIRLYGVSNTPVYLAPFGLEENTLAEADFPGENVKGIAAWSKNMDTPENRHFVNTIEAEFKKSPSFFTMMGWESALLVDTILKKQSETGKDVTSPEVTKSIGFTGPRGRVSLHEATNNTYAPMLKVTVVPTENGKCMLRIDDSLEDIEQVLDELSSIELNGIQTAWYNSYICI